ncbi:MAG: vWA domain-containing protein [Brevinematia bacterium]
MKILVNFLVKFFSIVFFLTLKTLSFAANYIIVIDTSLSMNRKVIDNQRIFDIAVKSLSNSIYQLKKGDIVYIVDFNEGLNIRQAIRIADESTKEAIYKVMAGTQPYGKWTFTYKMLEEVANLIKSEKLSPKETKVIIISDGIDDPPIKSKKYFVNLEKLSSLFDPQQLIYYISLEKLVKESEKESKETQIAKKIKEIKNIQIIEVSETNQVEKTIQESLSIKNFKLNMLEISLLSIAGLLILLILTRYFILPSVAKSKSKVKTLICISSTNAKVVVKLNKPKIVISNSNGNVVLKDFKYNGKIIIRSTMNGFRVFFTTPSPTNIKSGSILKRGDIFIVSNYTFTLE